MNVPLDLPASAPRNVLVVIPAFNEAETIAEVAHSALAHAARVLIVDDGSTDGTADILAELPVHVLSHPRNRGKSASLCDGFAWAIAAAADATHVLTMDADGQHRAADIPRLLRAAEAYPHALIIGARVRRTRGAPRVRHLANRVADFLISWACGHRLSDSQSGQRAYPMSLLREIDLAQIAHDGFTLESEVIIEAARLGYQTVSVPIDAVYGTSSRASHFKPVRHSLAIGAMVARRLARERFALRRLWVAIRQRGVTFDELRVDATMAPRKGAALAGRHGAD